MVRMRDVVCCAVVAAVMITVMAANAAPLKVGKKAIADFDGDGKPEAAALTLGTGKNIGDYVLRVGKTAIQGHGGEGLVGLAVVDLDTADKRKEIVLKMDGPSDFTTYLIYSYDGKLLHQIGAVQDATFPGNGSVLEENWTGSWSQTDKYLYDKTRGKLVLVPQEFHWIGRTVQVTKSFPIYKNRSTSAGVANLRTKSKVFLMVSDFDVLSQKTYASDPDPQKRQAQDLVNSWVLIKSESNLVGWAQLKTVQANTDIPMAG